MNIKHKVKKIFGGAMVLGLGVCTLSSCSFGSSVNYEQKIEDAIAENSRLENNYKDKLKELEDKIAQAEKELEDLKNQPGKTDDSAASIVLAKDIAAASEELLEQTETSKQLRTEASEIAEEFSSRADEIKENEPLAYKILNLEGAIDNYISFAASTNLKYAFENTLNNGIVGIDFVQKDANNQSDILSNINVAINNNQSSSCVEIESYRNNVPESNMYSYFENQIAYSYDSVDGYSENSSSISEGYKNISAILANVVADNKVAYNKTNDVYSFEYFTTSEVNNEELRCTAQITLSNDKVAELEEYVFAEDYATLNQTDYINLTKEAYDAKFAQIKAKVNEHANTAASELELG